MKLKKSTHTIGNRLWIIRGPEREVVKNSDGNVFFFEEKRQAKGFRDMLGKNYVVSPGPDHKDW